MSTNGNGANYAPLKQILSDSESEDDKLDHEPIKISDSCNNLDINSGLQSSKNYSMSDIEDLNTNLNTMESTMDNVSFLQSDVSNKMSFPRRCAFVGSIFLCIFTIVVFLWVLPCSDVGSCMNNEWQEKTMSWELPYDEIELSGTVQVVQGAIPNTMNLIFIYRGNHMKHMDKSNNDNINGVLLIVGNSGKVGWYTRENRIPTDINCKILDVNGDNQKDCIVSGSEGLLAALDSISGTYYWYIHKREKMFSNIADIDFPIVVKDMDNDKINDLLLVATLTTSRNHNSLVAISGVSGNVIGDPFSITDCISVKIIPDSDFTNITYLCKNATTEAVRIISHELLYKKIMKIDHSANHIPTTLPIDRRLNLLLRKNFGNTRETFTNGPDVDSSPGGNQGCHLTSVVKVTRLESELPKLFFSNQ
ncbi:Protein FAM234A [Eumeta japonica]|uniref:Protein FAM234A n=1 Tax=Eumeta variegata TaxID=151549 RepID=A0A4C1WA03_EUMVA|nr:Protein FAM234A [Eumeta japonica]